MAAEPKQIFVQSAEPVSTMSPVEVEQKTTTKKVGGKTIKLTTKKSKTSTAVKGKEPAVTAVDDDDDEIGRPDPKKLAVSKAKAPNQSKFAKKDLEDLENATEEQLVQKAKQIFKGEAFAFSGCQDAQESADVADAQASFGLKPVDEASKGGGAMTNSLISIIRETPDISFGDLLVEMRKSLIKKKYTQIPQLSCSQQMDLKETKFSLFSLPARMATRKFCSSVATILAKAQN
jgi:hypothetical protein